MALYLRRIVLESRRLPSTAGRRARRQLHPCWPIWNGCRRCVVRRRPLLGHDGFCDAAVKCHYCNQLCRRASRVRGSRRLTSYYTASHTHDTRRVALWCGCGCDGPGARPCRSVWSKSDMFVRCALAYYFPCACATALCCLQNMAPCYRKPVCFDHV